MKGVERTGVGVSEWSVATRNLLRVADGFSIESGKGRILCDGLFFKNENEEGDRDEGSVGGVVKGGRRIVVRESKPKLMQGCGLLRKGLCDCEGLRGAEEVASIRAMHCEFEPSIHQIAVEASGRVESRSITE